MTLEDFNSLQILKYPILTKLCIVHETSNGTTFYNCTIELGSENTDDVIVLHCQYVDQLYLNNPRPLLSVEIMITNITHYQLEEVKYKIREDNNDSFGFYCKDINIKLAPKM